MILRVFPALSSGPKDKGMVPRTISRAKEDETAIQEGV